MGHKADGDSKSFLKTRRVSKISAGEKAGQGVKEWGNERGGGVVGEIMRGEG